LGPANFLEYSDTVQSHKNNSLFDFLPYLLLQAFHWVIRVICVIRGSLG